METNRGSQVRFPSVDSFVELSRSETETLLKLIETFLLSRPGARSWQFDVPGPYTPEHARLAIEALREKGFAASLRPESQYNETSWYIDITRPVPKKLPAPTFGLSIADLDRHVEEAATTLCAQIEAAMRHKPGASNWRVQVDDSIEPLVVKLAEQSIREAGFVVSAGHDQVDYNQSALFFRISRPV